MPLSNAIMCGDRSGGLHCVWFNSKEIASRQIEKSSVNLSNQGIYGLSLCESKGLIVANDASRVFIGRMQADERFRPSVVLDYLKFSCSTIYHSTKLICGSKRSNSLKIIDFERGKELSDISQKEKDIRVYNQTNKIISESSRCISYSIHEDGRVRIADDRCPFFVAQMDADAPLNDLLVYNDLIYTADSSNFVKIFSIKERRKVDEKRLKGSKYDMGAMTLLKADSLGPSLFVGGSDGCLKVVNSI